MKNTSRGGWPLRARLGNRHTVFACCFANFFQAIGSVFPIILLPLRELYSLSYTHFGLLVSINFITQVSSDLLFSKPVDRYGFRRFMVGGPILSSGGLLVFAAAPLLFPGREFAGFCLGTFLFAAGGGLQELLLSPILDALPLPAENKARNMSLLHSFFAWGQIFVVLVSTLVVLRAGAGGWQALVLAWAVVPLISAGLFLFVPLHPRVPQGQAMRVRHLFQSKVFVVSLLAILCGGAAEVTMSQWASAFLERGLQLPKLLGDTMGVCAFSLMLALGRTWYGLRGKPESIHSLMIAGSAGALVCYLAAALSASSIWGMVACGLTGLCVSLLWPGAVIVAGHHLPLAGASMYALLSATGDIGASAGSMLTGRVADVVRVFEPLGLTGEQAGLRAGLLVAGLFSVGALASNLALRRAACTESRVRAEAGQPED